MGLKKSVYNFLITINPTPTAPRITRTPMGEAGAGVAVALGQGVGTFTVDFAVVFTIVTLVVGTVVVTVTKVGEREVMVAGVALLTVNVPVTVPPSTFRITTFHVPEAIPSRLKFLIMVVEVSVPTTAPINVDCPDCVRETVDPLKFFPVITMVCKPLFDAPDGVMLEIFGIEAMVDRVTDNVTVSPSSTVTLDR